MAPQPRLDEERPRPQPPVQRRPLRAPETASGGLRRSIHLRARRSGLQRLTASGKNRPRYDRMRRRALLPQNNCSTAPGINGIGVSAGVQLDAGLGKRGTVQSESLGLGLFGNGGGPGSLTAGGFRTSIDSTFSPSTAGTNRAFGAVAQGGVSIFATNAHSVRELSGPFNTISGAIGIGAGASFQYSYGGGIWQLSVGFTPLPGAVLGIGGSRTTSNTNVTPVGCRSK
jgi:hypothetical protein